LIAWTIFIVSVIVFVLKDFGFLPYNFFNKNVMLLGSAIETILISLALADKINTYKAEKEQAQMMALSKSEEVRMVLSQQNITLERMVRKRTEDLERANLELTQTLKNLQDAQVQLIQAEKMATLGQLTAGIAHEINNPINFVKSNVKPLQMDLYDLIALIQTYEKQLQLVLSTHALDEIEAIKRKINYPELIEEIRLLLKGIEEGAERTAEIIRGLRIFGRLDESELKKADIHECIDSSLILLRPSIPDDIVLEKHYAQLPLIACYPGKVNQMLMNLFTNAIHAIQSKYPHDPSGEKIIITTAMEPDGKHIRISVADTGIGIKPEIKQKIFEPFFTTKEVGEGTGLGLPIVYNIVEKHGGKIFVETTYGKGSEFIIILPTTPKSVVQTQEVKEQNN
jgi:two-component system NtrC family sensor kinase